MLVLVLGLAACGGNYQPGFTPGAPAPEDDAADASASVPPLDLTKISGVYTLASVSFDADPAEDVRPPVTLTSVLQTVTVSTNGKFEDVQVRLGQSHLIIGNSGNFSFYYSIVNEKGELTKVGAFQAGSMSGKIKTGVKSIGFDAGASNGLADILETDYKVESDAKSLLLTATVLDTPSPIFLVVSAIKE